MPTDQPSDKPESLNAQVRAEWEANARFWDGRFGDGNDFQNLLLGPATERLLALRPGELVLDAACGNGAFSRRMAQLGARVVAFDFAETFLARARERSAGYGDQIAYHHLDATDEAQLLTLGERRFDAVVCTMALMDMVVIDPLLSAVRRLLKPEGRFVFSVMHPCFNSVHVRRIVTEEDRDGELVHTHAIQMERYIAPSVDRGLGMIGQPVPQHYFHRPLSILLGACFAAGLALDGLEEPVFPPGLPSSRVFSWQDFREIPPVLVARLRGRDG